MAWGVPRTSGSAGPARRREHRGADLSLKPLPAGAWLREYRPVAEPPRRAPLLRRASRVVAADLPALGVHRGGGLRRERPRFGADPGARGPGAGQWRRPQRRPPEGPLHPDAGRPLGGDARRLPPAQPRVPAPPGRHAHHPPRPHLRRRVRHVRRLLAWYRAKAFTADRTCGS